MARVLVDYDGVLVYWDKRWDQRLDALGEPAANIPRSWQRTEFDLFTGLTADEHALAEEMLNVPGYYRDLEPIPGGKAALKRLVAAGHDVWIVTSPWLTNPTCASEKLESVAELFGFEWTRRTIITSDKTLVIGDYLIDDKPKISGAIESPLWRHVLFHGPYNVSVRPHPMELASWAPVHFEPFLSFISAPGRTGPASLRHR